jgi:hypothetical protein
MGRICSDFELDRRRAWRWQARAASGTRSSVVRSTSSKRRSRHAGDR